MTLSRANQFLALAILLTVVLYFGRQVLVPITLAVLLAMLMAPVCRWLDSKGWPRALSALSCVLALLIVILGMLAIVSAQIVSFSNDIPQMEKRADQILSNVQSFVQDKFSIEPEKQVSFAKKQISSLGKALGSRIGTVVSGIVGTIGAVVLMLVFTFLLLFHKEKYETFFVKLYKEENPVEVKRVLGKITNVGQDYLTGRAISMCIQAFAFAIGLTIIGVKNGILLGCIAGLLSLLPFVGPMLGGMFPVLTSIATEDSLNTTFWVIGLLVVIQILDNYLVEPNVVGGKVHLNALVTLIGIMVGGILWGVPGLIIFTPLLGITKIIFENVNDLKPYAYLIGDDEKDSTIKFTERLKKIWKK